MAGPDGGRVWEKAEQLPALSREHLGGPLQQLWRYTHPNLHACTSPYRHIYIYVCSRTRPASGVELEEVGRCCSSSLGEGWMQAESLGEL